MHAYRQQLPSFSYMTQPGTQRDRWYMPPLQSPHNHLPKKNNCHIRKIVLKLAIQMYDRPADLYTLLVPWTPT